MDEPVFGFLRREKSFIILSLLFLRMAHLLYWIQYEKKILNCV